ncbi:MAG TPA: hypothetical protein VIS94_12215 [Desulfomonilia bacterium]
MAEGYKIIDIGPDFAKRRIRGKASENYQMERRVTKECENYNKSFLRMKKNSVVE